MFSRRTALLLLLLCGLGSAVWVAGCSEAKDPWEGKPTPHLVVTVLAWGLVTVALIA